jgi:secondary thiamine-phosphate synthase enzyme
MYINLKTNSRNELVDITAEVEKIIESSSVDDGLCFIFCPHTTGAITINENADPSVQGDILYSLKKVFPIEPSYKHLEGNSDSHVKASLVGASETIAIENGKLILGTWQGIYFCEFDGPRSRKVFLKII